MTSDEAVEIQNLLKAALEELTDKQALLVLKRSLLLYFKLCLYPYPAPNLGKLPGPEGKLSRIGYNSIDNVKAELSPEPGCQAAISLPLPNHNAHCLLYPGVIIHLPKSLPCWCFITLSVFFFFHTGAMEDENSSPTLTKKDKLRGILLQSIDSVDPEKTLDFLKSSVKFRLQYCFSPTYNMSGPISSPEEPPTLPPMDSTPKTSLKPIEPVNDENSLDYLQETARNEGVRDESETTEDDEIENILSIITELNAKSESSLDEIPLAQSIDTSNDSSGKPFKPETAQKVAEAKHEKENALEEPKSHTNQQTDSFASSSEKKLSQVDGALRNSTASFVKNPHEENKLNGFPNTNPEINLEKTDSSEILVHGPNIILSAKPEHTDEYSVEETPDKVGKAELQGNSNEGEFSSVTRINYNELAFEDQRPEVV